MANFTSTSDIECRKDAEKYLSGLKIGSTLMFFQLPWKEHSETEMRADAGAFTVLHSTLDRWWEVGFTRNEELMVERFYSMEEAIAFIVLRWW